MKPQVSHYQRIIELGSLDLYSTVTLLIWHRYYSLKMKNTAGFFLSGLLFVYLNYFNYGSISLSISERDYVDALGYRHFFGD